MLEKEELWKLRRFTGKIERNKILNTLKGIIIGIGIDKIINDEEVTELFSWIKMHNEYQEKWPFTELFPLVQEIIKDKIITEEEMDDFMWLLKKIEDSSDYGDVITNDIQVLAGICHGILADNKISEEEVVQLENWLFENEQLVGVYPFDELESLIVSILADKVITEEERDLLKVFISDFVVESDSVNIDFSKIKEKKKEMCIGGICTINPQIEFKNKNFVFTGVSSSMSRAELKNAIECRGGHFYDTVILNTDYLIICEKNNPCWAFCTYGRKVEKAVNMRKQGYKISIIREVDFLDAIIE